MGRNAPSRLSVLRLGHRRDRDKRITSHLGLTARAFGADEVVLAGDRDPSALETWDSVTERFGGQAPQGFAGQGIQGLAGLVNPRMFNF